MIRRAVCCALCLLLLVLLAVPALALPIPNFTMVDGDTHVGVFKLKGESQNVLNFWAEFKASNRNIIFFSRDGTYDFVIALESANLKISDYGNQKIEVTSSGSLAIMRMVRDPGGGDFYTFSFHRTHASGVPLITDGVASGTFFKTTGYKPPVLSYDYIGDFEGSFVVVDDLDEGETGGGDGIFKQIWDWLTSFWQKLIDTLTALFVPPKDYYSGWFSEIKAAFEKKLGGMMGVIEYIKTSLSGVSSASSGLSFMFNGTKIDLLTYIQPMLTQLRLWLTGIIVIWTAIRCYKRIIALTNV